LQLTSNAIAYGTGGANRLINKSNKNKQDACVTTPWRVEKYDFSNHGTYHRLIAVPCSLNKQIPN